MALVKFYILMFSGVQ